MPAKTASAIQATEEEYIVLYNNLELSNAQVMEQLDATWNAVKVKQKYNKTVASKLTVHREGGAAGTHRAMTEDELNARPAAPAQPSKTPVRRDAAAETHYDEGGEDARPAAPAQPSMAAAQGVDAAEAHYDPHRDEGDYDPGEDDGDGDSGGDGGDSDGTEPSPGFELSIRYQNSVNTFRGESRPDVLDQIRGHFSDLGVSKMQFFRNGELVNIAAVPSGTTLVAQQHMMAG